MSGSWKEHENNKWKGVQHSAVDVISKYSLNFPNLTNLDGHIYMTYCHYCKEIHIADKRHCLPLYCVKYSPKFQINVSVLKLKLYFLCDELVLRKCIKLNKKLH
jgi:hypothetical protein